MTDPIPAFLNTPPATTAAQDANAAAGMPAMPPIQTARVNVALKSAQDLPGVVAALEATAPALADRLTTEKQSIHTSPLFGLAVAVVTLAVTHFGLNWTPDFVGLVVTAGALVGGYVGPYLETIIRKV